MKLPSALHRWTLTPRQAIALQKQLAGRIVVEPPRRPLRFVAGLDAAFSPDRKYCLSAVVLWDMEEQQVIEQHVAQRLLRFPYVPGLLSFREAPALLAVLRKLKRTPDVLMCDGQGVAHPRRLGIASHVGLLCGLPSIGCAKSRLIGEYREPGKRRGTSAQLRDRDEIIGEVLRTQTGVKPLYVSAGHLIDLPTARALVLKCATRFRLPEPTRLADRLVAQAKRAASD
jgi:deoxyribonuclease V